MMPLEEPSEPLARHTYSLHTRANGSIAGRVWTNDNLDQGHPSQEAEWEVKYSGFDHMRRSTGLTHAGMNGCLVEVFLDGQKV